MYAVYLPDQHNRTFWVRICLGQEEFCLVQECKILWVDALVEVGLRSVWLQMDVFAASASAQARMLMQASHVLSMTSKTDGRILHQAQVTILRDQSSVWPVRSPGSNRTSQG